MADNRPPIVQRIRAIPVDPALTKTPLGEMKMPEPITLPTMMATASVKVMVRSGDVRVIPADVTAATRVNTTIVDKWLHWTQLIRFPIHCRENILTMHSTLNSITQLSACNFSQRCFTCQQLLTYRTNCQFVSRWTRQCRGSSDLRSSKVMCGGRPDLKNSSGSSTLADFTVKLHRSHNLANELSLSGSNNRAADNQFISSNNYVNVYLVKLLQTRMYCLTWIWDIENFAAFLRTGSQRLNWGHRGQTLGPQM